MSVDQVFCKDKKDFCDGTKDCMECEFAKGNGVISGYVARDVLASLFGLDYDLDRLRELVEADRDGRCVIYQPSYPVASHYYQDEDGLCIREVSGVVRKSEYENAIHLEK